MPRQRRSSILVITNLYPSAAHPEFGTFVAGRVDALRAAGADVVVIASRDARVHQRVVRRYLALTTRAMAFALRSRVRGHHVDVVEAHIAVPTGLIAWPVARILGAQLILFAHGADVTRVAPRNRWTRILAARVFRAAARIVANGPYLAQVVVERFPAIADRVVVISPGIEFDRFAGDGAEATSGQPALRSGVLFVGRLVPEKGVDVLIRAVAALPPERRQTVTVIGDGPERDRARGLAADLGVRLESRGPLGRDEVAAAMRRAAVVAVPSVYPEPLGLVALEAMAAGAVVVVSSTGGLAGLVNDGRTGFLAPPADVAGWAAALLRAIDTAAAPAALQAMRAEALATARAHDVHAVALESLAMYGTLP